MAFNIWMGEIVKPLLCKAEIFQHDGEYINNPYGEYEDDPFAKFDGKKDKKENIKFEDEYATIIFIDKEATIKD